VVLRPLGATVGDFLDKPVSRGGLALSQPLASAVIAVFMIVCLSCSDSARDNTLVKPQRLQAIERQGGSQEAILDHSE
jgi:uncharacterized membrane-anchored protein